MKDTPYKQSNAVDLFESWKKRREDFSLPCPHGFQEKVFELLYLSTYIFITGN